MDPYNGDMKRPGFEPNPNPQQTEGASAVLHVRGLPPYVTQHELVSLVLPFGQVVRCLILHDKQQAFIQLESVDAASDMITSLDYAQPAIRGKPVFFQFSKRQELSGGDRLVMGPEAGASCTLLIAVSIVTVPVTLENIHQVTKPYGDVLRIITFTKNMEYQALVQFATAEQATNAKLCLDDKDLFQGCCHLRVSYSKRQHLVVKVNDHKSRDFTITAPIPSSLMGLAAMYGAPPPQLAAPPLNPMGLPPIGGEGCVLIVNKLHEEQTTPQVLFTLFGVYGDVLRVKILFNKRDTALVEFATEAQARSAKQNLNRCPLFGQLIQVNLSKHNQIQMPREEDGKDLTKDFTNSDAHRFKHKQFMSQKNVNPPSQVLHVANIHESVSEEDLIKLFATYQPTAPRSPLFEFFKTNRSMAYIGMNSVDEAVRALVNLHNYKLSYPLRVSFSHKDIRTMS